MSILDGAYFENEMKPKTNWDLLRDMSAEQFSEAFWILLDESKGWTDSREWLKEWLKSPVNRKDISMNVNLGPRGH